MGHRNTETTFKYKRNSLFQNSDTSEMYSNIGYHEAGHAEVTQSKWTKKKPERCIYHHSGLIIIVEVTGLEVPYEEQSSHFIIKITENKEVSELSTFFLQHTTGTSQQSCNTQIISCNIFSTTSPVPKLVPKLVYFFISAETADWRIGGLLDLEYTLMGNFSVPFSVPFLFFVTVSIKNE